MIFKRICLLVCDNDKYLEDTNAKLYKMEITKCRDVDNQCSIENYTNSRSNL